jgi:hypothetical protein
MATQFCLEHVFRAASPGAILAAYFDPANVLRQDRVLDITERTVLDLVDDGTVLRRTCRVVPQRRLPLVMRAFLREPLHYIETATWRRATTEIAVETRLSISPARPAITALYRLSRLSDGAIRRRFEGAVSVDVALVASRIERGIIAEYERSMPLAAAVTQAFLDQNIALPPARA